MQNHASILVLLSFLIAAIVAPTGAIVCGAPPNGLDGKAKEQRRRVEEHRRKVKQEIDATRRRLDANATQRPQASTNKVRRSDSVSEPKKVPQNFKYAFNGGKEFAYAFRLKFTTSDQQSSAQDLEGIAVFQATKNSGGRWEVLARDNIKKPPSSSGAQSPLVRGQKTTKLSRAFNVNSKGDDPILDGDLPALLGSIEDWFFPPIPPILQVKGGQRGAGTPVVRTDTGRWRDVGFYNPKDDSVRGYYQWEITPVENSNGVLKAEEKRSFRNRIGSLELTGQGTLTFDVVRGILLSRSFRATFTDGDVATTIAIDIVATDPAKLAR